MPEGKPPLGGKRGQGVEEPFRVVLGDNAGQCLRAATWRPERHVEAEAFDIPVAAAIFASVTPSRPAWIGAKSSARASSALRRRTAAYAARPFARVRGVVRVTLPAIWSAKAWETASA